MFIIANSGKRAYGCKDYIIASEDELQTLSPIEAAPGSRAFIPNGSSFVKNEFGKWVSAGAGSGSDVDLTQYAKISELKLVQAGNKIQLHYGDIVLSEIENEPEAINEAIWDGGEIE